MTPKVVGILNRDMLGTETAPGEHVDWNAPDYVLEEDFGWLFGKGETPETVAETSPHLIIFEAS